MSNLKAEGGPFKLCLSGYILGLEMYPTQAKKRLEWATLQSQSEFFRSLVRAFRGFGFTPDSAVAVH
jgi:hypothetical protein